MRLSGCALRSISCCKSSPWVGSVPVCLRILFCSSLSHSHTGLGIFIVTKSGLLSGTYPPLRKKPIDHQTTDGLCYLRTETLLTESYHKMTKSTQPELAIAEIRQILLRHEGTITSIANELGVRSGAVSQTLSGKAASKRIEEACRAKAFALLKQEKGSAA